MAGSALPTKTCSRAWSGDDAAYVRSSFQMRLNLWAPSDRS